MFIDYRILAKAQEFYTGRRYTQLETPWMVSAIRSALTLPRPDFAFKLADGRHMVGSAEQGFLETYEQLEPGKAYFSIGPCFRNEQTDLLHQTQFMKLELFARGVNLVERFIRDATDFYRDWHAGGRDGISVVQTSENSFDVNIGEIEVGSYSFYEKDGLVWSCGTGLALPRFEVAEVQDIRAHQSRWPGDITDDEIWEGLAHREEHDYTHTLIQDYDICEEDF